MADNEFSAFMQGLINGQEPPQDDPKPAPHPDDDKRIGDTVTFVPSQPVEVEEARPEPTNVVWPADFLAWCREQN